MVFHKINCTGFLAWGKSDDPCPGETEDEETEPVEIEVDVNGNPIPTASDSYD